MTAPVQLSPVPAPVGEEAPLRRFLSDFCASKLALLGLALLLVVVGAAVFAPWIAPQNPYDIGGLDILDSKLPPGSEAGDGSMRYWLGTDGLARDVLSAIIYGMRTSLIVGTVSVLAAFAIGATVGLIAAYFGGRIDALLMRIVDIQLSFPAILVALILLAILGKGVDKGDHCAGGGAMGLFRARKRGAALVERGKGIRRGGALPVAGLGARVAAPCAAQLHAASHRHRHDRPGACDRAGSHAVVPGRRRAGDRAVAGHADRQRFSEYLLSGHYWISFFPGIALAIAIIAINLVGDHLRDVLNPRNAG